MHQQKTLLLEEFQFSAWALLFFYQICSGSDRVLLLHFKKEIYISLNHSLAAASTESGQNGCYSTTTKMIMRNWFLAFTQQSQASFQINNFSVLYLTFFFRLAQIQKVTFLSFRTVCIFPVSESSYILAIYKEKSQLNLFHFDLPTFTWIKKYM